MAIQLYDEAIAAMVQSWLKDQTKQTIKIMKPEETAHFFQMTDDEKADAMLTLPLIMVSRKPTIDIAAPTKQPTSYDGVRLQRSTSGKQTALLNSINVGLEYQIDIFTKKFIEADEFIRDVTFKLVNHPKLTIKIPYNANKISGTVEHTFTLELVPTIEDNSDIPERAFKDQFTRMTIGFTVTDARFWSIPAKNNYKIKEIIFEAVNLENEVEMEEPVEIDSESNN